MGSAEAAEGADRVVLIGGSYIGCEVAASLTAKGTDCAIVMMEDVALSRTFGEEAGRWFHELLESKGVEIHGGETLAAFEGDGGVKARGHREREGDRGGLRGGRRGREAGRDARPEGRARGRRRDAVCDATLQTSVEGIYAAGDVCSYDSRVHGRRLRVEHWDVAMQQGQHAARCDDRRGEAVRGGALLLQRPRGLGGPRVRRARRPTGTRWSGAATATRASSRSSTSRTGRSREPDGGALGGAGHARTLLAKGVDVAGTRKDAAGGPRQRPR